MAGEVGGCGESVRGWEGEVLLLKGREAEGYPACEGREEWVAERVEGDDCAFHTEGYARSAKECVGLWLRAFDDMVCRMPSKGNGGENGRREWERDRKKGYFKVTAIGMGFFADVVRSGINIGDTLMPLMLRAVEETLSAHSYPNLAAIKFPDFSGRGLFTPALSRISNAKNDIEFVKAPYRDVLDFDQETRERYVCGVLNPGDCFACARNELGYGSVEAMIGHNTTVRRTQYYIWNEEALDKELRIAVEP